MLAGQIAGLPSVWNCKHSGEGSLGHSRNVLNWRILGRVSRVFAFFLWDRGANRVACDHSPVLRENHQRGKEGEQMLIIPRRTENWETVMPACSESRFRQEVSKNRKSLCVSHSLSD